MSETWKSVVGYEGRYEVSDLGRVRNSRTGRVLRGGKSGYAYPAVALACEGWMQVRMVHILVMEAFAGPRPAGYFIHHKDANTMNARLDNLEYVTPAENTRAAILERWRQVEVRVRERLAFNPQLLELLPEVIRGVAECFRLTPGARATKKVCGRVPGFAEIYRHTGESELTSLAHQELARNATK